VHDGLFRVDEDGSVHLLGGYSPSSGKHHFPRLPACPYTGAEDVEPADLADHGELPEGLRVITRLTESDPARLEFGMAMRLVVAPLHTDSDGNEVVTYAFEPAS
jgi:uncharacterized OB-fold protein